MWRSGVILCWLVILGIVAYTIIENASHAKPRAGGLSSQPTRASSPADAVDIRVSLMGKYAVGWSSMLQPNQRDQLTTQVETAAQTPTDLIAAATVTGEFSGTDAAVEKLSNIDHPDATAFIALYQQATPLPDATQQRYGFFSDLAVSHGKPPTDPTRASVLSAAQRTAFVLVAMFLIILIAGLAGLGLLITAIVFLILGKLRLNAPGPVGKHELYLQAFTIYLVGLSLVPLLLSFALPKMPLPARVTLMTVTVAAAVAYPLLRGAKFSQLRLDWGISPGRSPFLEPLFGILGYLAGLPLLAVAIFVTAYLSKLANYDVSHPITQVFARHPWLMFFLAVVFAPITEELLFRGALLSHCRKWSGPVLAGALTGFVFAAIHPQGWPAIPVLGTMGFVFAMIRQWRGSLIPAITAHALNNGFIFSILLLTR